MQETVSFVRKFSFLFSHLAKMANWFLVLFEFLLLSTHVTSQEGATEPIGTTSPLQLEMDYVDPPLTNDLISRLLNPCYGQKTSQSCTTFQPTEDPLSKCIWELTTNGQHCVKERSNDYDNYHMSDNTLKFIKQLYEDEFNGKGHDIPINSTTEVPIFATSSAPEDVITDTPTAFTPPYQTVIYEDPEPNCECPTTASYPTNDENEDKDELDFFGANVVERIRKVQASSPRIASAIRHDIQKALFDNELLVKAPKKFFYSGQ